MKPSAKQEIIRPAQVQKQSKAAFNTLYTAPTWMFQGVRTGIILRHFGQLIPLITKTPMTALERRTVAALAGLYCFRMLGLFMVLPLLALYAQDYTGSSAFLLGLALGAYGLAQALLQIPLGMLSDRIGRVPVIVVGLLVFAAGSLWAAQAESIYGVIGGRFMQGAGAIASTVMALLSDLTRDEQRTKAMAIVGMSIGLAFAVALVAGPILASFGGLSAVFNVTAGLAFIGIVIVLFAVPRARQIRPTHGETGTVPALLLRSLFEPALARLNLGIFALHFILMAMFVVLPLVLEDSIGVHRDGHWKVYLPVLALSIAGMATLMIVAERYGRLKNAFLLAVLAIGVSQWALGGAAGPAVFYLGLWLFFVGFNYLEASLPSLVSKTVYAGGKGTALGVYSSFQFLGAFAGGLGGGWALQNYGASGVFACCALVALIWWLVCLTMRAPPELANLVVRLPAKASLQESWVSRLRDAPGVADLLLLAEEDTVYLKVDETQFDRTILAELDA
jgi:MFS family permease